MLQVIMQTHPSFPVIKNLTLTQLNRLEVCTMRVLLPVPSLLFGISNFWLMCTTFGSDAVHVAMNLGCIWILVLAWYSSCCRLCGCRFCESSSHAWNMIPCAKFIWGEVISCTIPGVLPGCIELCHWAFYASGWPYCIDG